MEKNSVFISYRRSDTTGEAGRLTDSLESLLNAACVFRDTDDIQAGEEFAAVFNRELTGTQAVVVLIGKQWLPELTARLAKHEPDYVRMEVAAALRLGKRVIPVLIQGAELPVAEQLPEDLRGLLSHQSLSVREEAWNQDMGRLADAIGRPYPWRKMAIRAAFSVPIILIATKYGIDALAPESTNQIGLARGVVLGFLALYGIIEVALWRRTATRQRQRP
jgi:hypothetical protein